MALSLSPKVTLAAVVRPLVKFTTESNVPPEDLDTVSENARRYIEDNCNIKTQVSKMKKLMLLEPTK